MIDDRLINKLTNLYPNDFKKEFGDEVNQYIVEYRKTHTKFQVYIMLIKDLVVNLPSLHINNRRNTMTNDRVNLLIASIFGAIPAIFVLQAGIFKQDISSIIVPTHPAIIVGSGLTAILLSLYPLVSMSYEPQSKAISVHMRVKSLNLLVGFVGLLAMSIIFVYLVMENI